MGRGINERREMRGRWEWDFGEKILKNIPEYSCSKKYLTGGSKRAITIVQESCVPAHKAYRTRKN